MQAILRTPVQAAPMHARSASFDVSALRGCTERVGATDVHFLNLGNARSVYHRHEGASKFAGETVTH